MGGFRHPLSQKVAPAPKKKKSWEAQELSDINKNWQRPWGGREAERVKSTKKT
jgi:hypothetical protein